MGAGESPEARMLGYPPAVLMELIVPFPASPNSTIPKIESTANPCCAFPKHDPRTWIICPEGFIFLMPVASSAKKYPEKGS